MCDGQQARKCVGRSHGCAGGDSNQGSTYSASTTNHTDEHKSFGVVRDFVIFFRPPAVKECCALAVFAAAEERQERTPAAPDQLLLNEFCC